MIKLPNISEEGCTTDDTGPKCAETFLEDELIIKPGVVTVCSTVGTIQFRVFVRSSSNEIPLLDVFSTLGVTFSSSDTDVFTVDENGLVTIVAAGKATLSASWQGKTAFAQIEVLGGADCCDAISVGTIIVVDRSFSMTKSFNSTFGSKFEAVRKIVRDYVAAMDVAKDDMGLIEFDSSPRSRIGMTNDPAFLQAAIAQMSAFHPLYVAQGDTNIAAALDFAMEVLDACTPEPAASIEEEGGGGGGEEAVEHNFHGSGPPSALLGVSGDTYVDDDTNEFYWRSVSGWQPT